MISLSTTKSHLQIDLQNGGKITELVLSSDSKEYKVIESFDDLDFYLSGSYFLFPWVNRVSSPQIYYSQNGNIFQAEITADLQDSNGFPSHGLYSRGLREIIQIEKNRLLMAPINWNKKFPYFTEEFILYADRLVVKTQFQNRGEAVQFFSYGYHPYFSLDRELKNCRIHTNLDTYIPLQENLLPPPSYSRKQASDLFPNGKIETLLDHCLTGNNSFHKYYFGVEISEIDRFLYCLSENSEIPLPYFQLYTPDTKRIAIEPMSSCGDVFNNPNSTPSQLLPGETKTGTWEILLTKSTIYI